MSDMSREIVAREGPVAEAEAARNEADMFFATLCLYVNAIFRSLFVIAAGYRLWLFTKKNAPRTL